MTNCQSICHSCLDFEDTIGRSIGVHAFVTVMCDFRLAFSDDPFIAFDHLLCEPILLFSCMWKLQLRMPIFVVLKESQ